VVSTVTNLIGRSSLLCCMLLALGAGSGVAQEDSPVKFQRVGSETGPPPEVIAVMLQDRIGFVWIGSREGLFRYDGETFVTFRHDPGDPGSISGNTVRAIFEDRAGRLWFGTNSAGLNRLDRATGRFEHFRHVSGDPTSLSHDSVYEIDQDSAGNIWVATQKGLNRYDDESATFTRFLHDPDDPHSLSHDYVTRVLVDGLDRVWAGTNGGGLNLLDRSSGGFVRYLTDESGRDRPVARQVFAICEGTERSVWVGGQGLFRLDPDSGAIVSFEPDDDDPSAFVDGLVVELVMSESGTLWIGTFGSGLHSLDLATGRKRSYRHEAADRHSLGEDKIMDLMIDSTDALWVGTWGGGAWRLTDPALQLASAQAEISAPGDVRSADVTALASDRDGRLWIGTRFGDVLSRDPRQSGFDRHSTTIGTVNEIEQADDGMIWIAKANGLERINTETSTVSFFRHDPEIPSSIGPGYVTALLQDDDGGLWVGTGEGGLQRLDSRGQVVERWLHDPEDPTSLSDNYVKALAQDVHGTIWVGTRSGGLNSFDPASGSGRRFLPDPRDPSSISYHSVTTVFRDSRDRMWIGTDGGGLNEIRTRSDGEVAFDRISSAEGLIDETVMAILEDDDGSLWISTKRGLSRFDPQSRRFSQLYVGDGLPAGAFEPGAAARTDDTLYFGSVRWLAAVPAGRTFPDHPPSPVVITSIRDIEGKQIGGESPWLTSQLEVPYGGLISLTLAVLDFNVEHHHRFQVRLGGDDEPWVDMGSRREITFMDLDPGTHQFAARARNCQGVWSDLSQNLTIRVPPPFWMTWWFRAAVVLVLLGVVLGWHRLRTLRLRRRNLELLEIQRQRKKAQAKLSRAYDQLRGLTRRLEATKEEERRRIARELHDEMGPALTAVIINLQLINGGGDPGQSRQRVDESIEIVDRMVQQIRDLSLALRPPLLDEVGFLSAIRGYLETEADRTGLRIDVESSPDLVDFPAEVEITAFRLIQAAVSNVIRHAHASVVEVSIRLVDESLSLTIRDDGVGFDPGTVMNPSASGSSVGLVGMKERVQILGGEFSIESEPGRGTRVVVRIPVEVAA
jgi:signal transduction histidine kinase/ligand-binding sensor domain-containing protein